MLKEVDHVDQITPSWAVPETDVTLKMCISTVVSCCALQGLLVLGLFGAASCIGGFASKVVAAIGGYPATRNDAYRLDRDLTPEKEATT